MVDVRPDRLTSDDVDVDVLPEVGARLHRVRAFGHDLLRTPDDPRRHLDDPFFWGGYLMTPWCNRLEAAPIDVAGRRLALPSNFPDGTAIHGQVYARSWERLGDGTYRVRGGGDGWPWPYEAGVVYTVRGATLVIGMFVTNHGDTPMPAGIGIHPWFRRPIQIAIHGDAVYPQNLATARDPEPVTGAYDLRRLGTMADDLDATWVGLADPAVEMAWPDAPIGMTMSVAGPTPHIVAASPHDVDAVAVEPETHAPQGLRRLLGGEPGGLAWLEPGATLGLEATLAFHRLDG